MHIAILTHNYPRYPRDGHAAAGLFVPDFARALQRLGHEVTVLTPNVVGEKTPDPTLPVRWYAWRGGDKKLGHLNPRRPADSLALISLFYRGCQAAIQLASGGEIDRFLALWAAPSGIFAYAAHLRLGIPYDVWALGSDIWVYGRHPLLRGVVRQVLRQADCLFTEGPTLGEEVEQLSGRPYQILPIGRLLPVQTTVPASVDPEKFHFLFIARWEPAKGPDVLLDAFARVVAKNPLTHLHMFGGGTLEGVIHSKLESHHLQKNVTLYGYADPATVVAYMKACNVLVMPSRIETIPILFSDAMQVGIPVVATNVGDQGHVVRQYRVGVVVDPEDPEALAEAMSKASNGKLSILQEAFQAAASAFGVEGMTRTYVHSVGQTSH